MPRDPSYGELAYHTFNAHFSAEKDDFEALDADRQLAWQNTAAAVLAEYHKRQSELSRQTPLRQEELPPGGPTPNTMN
jgi:hypothetical protein